MERESVKCTIPALQPGQAASLIRKHDYAAVSITKSNSSAAMKRLERTAAALFKALTGAEPTPEQIRDMTKW